MARSTTNFYFEYQLQRVREYIRERCRPFDENAENEKARRRRQKKALKDLRFFGETYFPHYLTLPPSPMHRAFYAQFQTLIERAEAGGDGGRAVHAAPRGHAKSTLASLILPLWCVVGERRRFIAIVSDTSEQAGQFLEFIKAELTGNARLQEDFPEACGTGPTWQSATAITRNNVKLKTWGKRESLRGARHGPWRPDLVIGDDLENDENIDSPEQRDKDRRWFFKALMKIGARNTVFVVVGTVLHYDSLLANLIGLPGWQGRKWQAVIRWSTSPLWETWDRLAARGRDQNDNAAEEFFNRHRDAMLAGTETLWPEREDYLYLMKMRLTEGPAHFDSEKQNEPIHPDDCLFQERWFVFWDDSRRAGEIPNPDERVFCAVDPSMGKDALRSDPSAIVIGVRRADGVIDLLEADIRRRSPDVIMEDLFQYHAKYRFERVVVEEVQFQELFKDQLIREGAKRGAYLPVEGTRPQTDKRLRLAKLQPHIKNGTLRFRCDQRTLIDQLKYFPKAAHDDGPDALEMLFSLIARHTGSGPRVRSFQ